MADRPITEEDLPPELRKAINLVWVLLALMLLHLMLDLAAKSGAMRGSAIFGRVFGLGFVAFINYKLSSGKKWPRTVFAVLTVIGLIFYVPIYALAAIFILNNLSSLVNSFSLQVLAALVLPPLAIILNIYLCRLMFKPAVSAFYKSQSSDGLLHDQ